MLAGPGRFHRRVQRQQVGLAGDLLHDGDLLGDGLHGVHRALDRLAALFGVLGRLAGDLLGLGGVVGVLLDVGRHLLHRGGRLLGRGGLFGGALATLLGAGRQLLAAGGDVLGGRQRVGDDTAQPLDHPLQRHAQRVLFGEGLGLDHQVAVGHLVGERGGGPQVGGHDVDRVDQVLDLIVGGDRHALVEVAARHAFGEGADPAQPLADAGGDPHRGADRDQQRHEAEADQGVAYALEVGVGLVDVGVELRLLGGDHGMHAVIDLGRDLAALAERQGDGVMGVARAQEAAHAVVDIGEATPALAQRLPLRLALGRGRSGSLGEEVLQGLPVLVDARPVLALLVGVGGQQRVLLQPDDVQEVDVDPLDFLQAGDGARHHGPHRGVGVAEADDAEPGGREQADYDQAEGEAQLEFDREAHFAVPLV